MSSPSPAAFPAAASIHSPSKSPPPCFRHTPRSPSQYGPSRHWLAAQVARIFTQMSPFLSGRGLSLQMSSSTRIWKTAALGRANLERKGFRVARKLRGKVSDLQDQVHFGGQENCYFLGVAGGQLICLVLNEKNRYHCFPSTCTGLPFSKAHISMKAIDVSSNQED